MSERFEDRLGAFFGGVEVNSESTSENGVFCFEERLSQNYHSVSLFCLL